MSTDKIRSEFEKFQLSKYHPSVLEFIDGRYVRGVVNDEFAMHYHGWQAALSQSEPEVNQPVRCRCGLSINCNGDDDGCIDPAMGRIIKPQVSQPVAVYSFQYGHKLETENEALKLRVAELEDESRTKHKYAMQMLGERDRLQSECEILNVRLALAMMPESERLAKLQGA